MHADAKAPALKLLAAERPLVIGHRGFCARAPENTLPSFRLALEAGADLVELDFHHSRDGVPMAIHDDTLDRTTDARRRWRSRRIPVSSRTASEIQTLDAGSWFDARFAGAKVPRLDEALEAICDCGVALVEHKSGDAATCVQLFRERGWINRAVIISFNWKFLREVHALEPGQVLGALGAPTHLADGRKPPRRRARLSRAWLEDLEATGASLAVWNRQVPDAAVQFAHERGLKVWVYTVNEPKTARQLVRIGVNGIITNEPVLIRTALQPERG